MTQLGFFAILLTLAAVFGVLNYHTLRLPNTVGVLVIALLVSLVMLAVDPFIAGYDLQALAGSLLSASNLPQVLLNGVLSFLLFAGTLHVDFGHLWARKFTVAALAIVGTVVAVALFGAIMWLMFPLVGPPVPLLWCMVLGAILAPTDPVSVVAMLRRVGLPAPLQAVFAGESLFNDGVGVVLFGVAVGAAASGQTIDGATIITHFLIEAVGGACLGLALGWVAMQLMRSVDDSHLELIISLALATGTFSLANAIGASGPIAVVVAGLTLSARSSLAAISHDGRQELMTFWSLIDEVLNAILFLLIGFEVIAVSFRLSHLAAVAIAIPLSILVRAISVWLATLPVNVPRANRGRALVVLTWGGLRGGISVALALGLPDSDVRASLLTVCYGVVVFSIIAQGVTIERVARRFYQAELT